MPHRDTIFASILKALPRRRFETIVSRHDGDRYVKRLRTWDQFVAQIYAQFSHASSLRAVEAGWNANAHHHYHLGAGPVRRSTLSDANRLRPAAIFADVFSWLSGLADRRLKREGAAMVRLIDSSPVPVDQLFTWAQWNGRTKGLKLHVVYDPHADHPRLAEITPARVNDVNVGRAITPEPGAIYVFDKGYSDYGWWSELHRAGCRFVTRPKTNVHFNLVGTQCGPYRPGDGYTVLEDSKVLHRSQGKTKLAMGLRRITIRRHTDKRDMLLITNDLERTADEIAMLYKTRWQIELLFRWIKQHLKIRSFLGRSENAVRVQIFIAMISYLLLRIAAKNRTHLTPIRFIELVCQSLFERKHIAQIDKPQQRQCPPTNDQTQQIQFVY